MMPELICAECGSHLTWVDGELTCPKCSSKTDECPCSPAPWLVKESLDNDGKR